MYRGALALDIDGTLNTADAAQVTRLQRAAKRLGFDTHINTARPMEYCATPDPLTTRLAGAKRAGKHHCLVDRDPPTSKVKNMHTIKKMSNVHDPKCVILVDDRPENIKAVEDAGFTGIKVNDRTGIRKKTVDHAIDIMQQCSAEAVATRGAVSAKTVSNAASVTHVRSSLRRLLIRIVLVTLIALLLVLLCFT